MVTFKDIRWREARLENFLNGERGAVGKYLYREGRKIVKLAKSQVGVQTGALKASIHITKRGKFYAGQYIQIGSNLPYALYHHQGTRPRVLVPKKRRVMRFFIKGLAIFRPVVMQPGTRPNRYLTDAMKTVIK